MKCLMSIVTISRVVYVHVCANLSLFVSLFLGLSFLGPKIGRFNLMVGRVSVQIRYHGNDVLACLVRENDW